ncbi:MAG: NAD(P)H-dependent oxidoreductase [Saccharospirillaceae bacterium]|nr:NAD(P)H-dependent oxidoreductase [Pseudomonadales bacterium]NRB80596.1 NAD(P)H-dependent oxidoreductase [Saccharospirillaceae bacterium]
MSIKNVLIIKSSPAGDSSVSNQVADDFTAQIKNKDASINVVVRDLAVTQAPQLDSATLGAFFTPADQASAQQIALSAPSIEYIDELKEADLIVVASAMHNFSITSLLKSYVDQICRAGLTFHYTANGPEGLLTNKKALVIASAGGDYSQDFMQAMDFQTPYLKQIFKFVGVDDFTAVPVQGVAGGGENTSNIIENAKQKIKQFINTL